jgi:hypothetical protein
MHPKLVRLQTALSESVRDLSADQLIGPAEGKWSIAQILEHLNLTYVGTIKNLERCIAEGKPRASADRNRHRWARIAVARMGLFPSGRKSPERALPKGMPFEQAKTEMMENLARMDAMISQCEDAFPSGVAIADHPLLGPFTASEWRGFHLAHGRHHAKQIVRLRRELLLRN